jgi:hypothetical protein
MAVKGNDAGTVWEVAAKGSFVTEQECPEAEDLAPTSHACTETSTSCDASVCYNLTCVERTFHMNYAPMEIVCIFSVV